MSVIATPLQSGLGSQRPPSVVIEPRAAYKLLDWRECVEYRDLLYFLVLRDVTVLYKQTILGIAWAVLNPFFSMVVFTVIFGMLLKVPSDGKPYAAFSFAALLP
jgi:lipopolysaccharide transport system permease protein